MDVNTSELTQDQKRIQEWKQVRESVPNDDMVEELRTAVEDAERELKDATALYEESVARRALVIGWTEVAEQEGVSAKRVHSWHRQYIPGEEDMTDVPRVIIPREQKRIAAMEEQVRKQRETEKMVNEQAEKFRELMKGWK